MNGGGNYGKLEAPCYVEGGLELVDIMEEDVQTALKRTKKERAPGIDGVHTDMLIAAGEVEVSWTKRLLNVCMREGLILEHWRTGLFVSIWKRKSDVQDPSKYRVLRS